MTPNKPDTSERTVRYIPDGLDRQNAETLREIVTHAESLAAWEEVKAETELEEDEDIIREDSAGDSSLPDDVSKKVGAVVKTVNDNQYYYYQWRESDQVKSKYEDSTNPSE